MLLTAVLNHWSMNQLTTILSPLLLSLTAEITLVPIGDHPNNHPNICFFPPKV